MPRGRVGRIAIKGSMAHASRYQTHEESLIGFKSHDNMIVNRIFLLPNLVIMFVTSVVQRTLSHRDSQLHPEDQALYGNIGGKMPKLCVEVSAERRALWVINITETQLSTPSS